MISYILISNNQEGRLTNKWMVYIRVYRITRFFRYCWGYYSLYHIMDYTALR